LVFFQWNLNLEPPLKQYYLRGVSGTLNMSPLSSNILFERGLFFLVSGTLNMSPLSNNIV
jgi:hypothetical protein